MNSPTCLMCVYLWYVDPLQCGTQGKAFALGASILARKDWPCSSLIIQLSGLPYLSFTKSFLFFLVLHSKYIFFLLSIYVSFPLLFLPPLFLPFLKIAISLSKIIFPPEVHSPLFLKICLSGNQEKAESNKNKGHMFPEGRNNQVCWTPLRHKLGWEQKSERYLWSHRWSW